MKKRSRKLISILLTLALLATLLVPMATPAAASATYSVSNAPTLAPTIKGVTPATASLGLITVTMDAQSVVNSAYGKFVYLELPADFEFRDAAGARFVAPLATPANYSFSATESAFAGDDVSITAENNGNRLKIRVDAGSGGNVFNGTPGKPGQLTLENLKLFVPSGAADGPVTVTTVAPSSSFFTSGQKFDVAKIGASAVKVFVNDQASLGPDGGFITFYVQEASGGAMANSASALKLTLPPGFSWRATGGAGDLAKAWTSEVYWNGGTASAQAAVLGQFTTVANDSRDLVISNAGGTFFNGSYFKVKAYVNIDPLNASKGNIEFSMGGDSTYTPSSLQVGTYGEFGQKLSAASTPDIWAGTYGQKIGNVVLEEQLKGSLVNGRSLYLTLPAGAKWVKFPQWDSANTTSGGITQANFLRISNDARTAIFSVAGIGAGTSDKAKLVFKDGEVITAADFAGELKVTPSGSLGFNEDVVVGKVKPAVSTTITGVNEVKIGVANQAIGDITIEEVAKEIFVASNNFLTLNVGSNGLVQEGAAMASVSLDIEAPNGVTFASMPTITVDGNVRVDSTSSTSTLASNKRVISITIQSTSTKPSKIVLKDVKLNVDRTVTEGDLKLGIGGSAIIDDQITAADRIFTPARYAAEVVAAKVVTPAPVDSRSTSSFIIGKTTYTVSGVEKTMDVAPYVKNGRTYLPVRYVASALGVLDSNILWDEATQKVTLLKGDKVVQLTIGSNAMIVNGVTITMDSAPEITSGRTMLPFRFIAQAMGSSVAWDEATQTVTLN